LTWCSPEACVQVLEAVRWTINPRVGTWSGADASKAGDEVGLSVTITVGCIGPITMFGGLLAHLHSVRLIEVHAYALDAATEQHSSGCGGSSRDGDGGLGGGGRVGGNSISDAEKGDLSVAIDAFAAAVVDDVMRQLHTSGVATMTANTCLIVSDLIAGDASFTVSDLALGRTSAVEKVKRAAESGGEVTVRSFVLADGWRIVPVVKHIQVGFNGAELIS
jgi:hypothetical protein